MKWILRSSTKRVGDCGADFVYVNEEKGAAQRGALRDPIGLVVGTGQVISNSNLE